MLFGEKTYSKSKTSSEYMENIDTFSPFEDFSDYEAELYDPALV